MSHITELCRKAAQERAHRLGTKGRLTRQERKELVTAHRLANVTFIH
ncbi:hypothetical protein K1W69_20460 [Hoeflea sp. WL0058]|uniref:Uncharacterized protein n=1 Tax=Flavimaribacter sediminis TaxID=2865987 RepID=A0AAE3D2V7_9HYPH|nr:hypothetical protein [Flavimaribacter sediminis]MBW8639577.1 hypothetical protein [Flavimaribacter sediminis]